MEPLAIQSDGTINIPGGRYTAQQLDDLLHQLALTRAEMTPAVSETIPKAGQFIEVEDPTVRFAALEGSPLLSLCFRHPAFGWQYYCFTFDACTRFYNSLGAFLRKGPLRPEPFVGGNDRSH